MPILKAKASKGKVRDAIAYVLSKAKSTLGVILNMNLGEDYAKQMERTARMWGKDKPGSRQFYHFKLAFHPDDSDKQGGPLTDWIAIQIATKIAKEFFPGYQAVLSVHNDTEHKHVHMIISAVCPTTGRKINMNDSEYRRMKDRADELSLEYGLRTIGWREAVRKKRGEEILPNLPVKYCFAEQGMHGQGKVSWKDELRRTIEAARAQSGSLDEFREYLADSDVTLTRCTEKGIVYKYKDYPPVRGDTLGGDYDDPKTALLNGDIDVATTANYKQAKSLENEPNMAVLEGQSLWVCRLFFNFDDPGLATKEVRQAFAYAIDRNELLQKAFKGAGLPGTAGFVHPDSNWYNPNIPTYDKDVDKAKQLLADAGAVDSNGDGVLEFQGKPMSYELMISANDEAMGEMLKSYLAAVGIELSVKAVDDNTVKQTYQEGNFQLIANGHGSFGGDPKYMAMLATNTAGAAKITVQGGNRWKSEEYDTTFAASLKELDQAKREALVDKLQEIVAEDVPTLPLYYKSNAAAFNKSVFDGFYYTKDGISSGIPYLYNKIILATGTWNKD